MTIAGPIGIAGLNLDATAEPAEEIDAAARLEELGYQTLWLPGSLPPIDTIIRGTTTLRVASGIISVDRVPATEVAATYAALEADYPGRFVVGLGGAHGPKPLPTLNAYLDALDTATPVVPASERVLAALGPRMLGLSRERAGGAYPYLVTPDYVADARKLLGDGPALAVLVPVIPFSDPDAAREIARASLGFFTTVPGYRRNFGRMGFDEADITGLSDTFVDGVTIWGDLEAIVTRIAEYRAAGADQVVLGLRLPQADASSQAATWQARLAEALFR
ncbi:TIGR03620 family F420-dependent LLM class oxidoreductase [Frankia sp. CNm7]|uniref:TIGR03620 family F420-dependent LLM class oxidoreductase n=1 Tax=Frankia nepalensis TaxID=1836974 RepID=A0A937R817_9ACTN|nr:TIGR03620 family F420-dependent LLM class oxidoreductase [Frankia nepalensis]MBL7497132.1 TIGR03620 family F420-dependent LLM class oxidoreductase [Frankia nepalensis]MBL7509515.1 TIGR03620 family F420-dependent LLM class oxidoreductase [Frankia nepalensis]MBL7517454.1 TIGR03620 family F420-dependent LLM class oxidoreductase [Frankia nepalensis]MBL7627066.1 TIGR03620 family F420-dependent LLM class oxidoreductase [Frankia nepalensis]